MTRHNTPSIDRQRSPMHTRVPGILAGALLVIALAGSAVAGSGPTGALPAAPVLAPAAGGPDEFGYTWTNSLDPGGPSYAWDEIAAVGTLVDANALHYTGYAGPLPIGFAFDYYDAAYNQIYISRNGYVSFGRGYADNPANFDLPSFAAPNNEIAMYGGDIQLTDYGNDSRVFYATLTNPQRLVVEYLNIYPCCSGSPMTFQVVLFPGGDIEVRYKQTNSHASEFIGIENHSGWNGLRYNGGIADNLAVRFRFPIGVQLTPASFSNIGAPASSVTYTLSLINRTGIADNFNIALDLEHAWPVSLSITQTGALAANASLDLDVVVDVPSGTPFGAIDQVTVHASSAVTPTYFDTSVLTTTASDGDVAIVSLQTQNAVALVDSHLHNVIDTIDLEVVGCNHPGNVAKSPSSQDSYINCNSIENVAVLDLATRRIKALVGNLTGPTGIAFSRDGSSVFVVSRSTDEITRIDSETYVTDSIHGGYGNSYSIVAHPFLDLAYIAATNGTVVVLNTATFEIADVIHAHDVQQANAIVITPDGQWVYVGSPSTRNIVIIDTHTNSVRSTLREIYSTQGSLAMSPDGSTLYVAGSDVKAIDTASNEVVGVVATPDQVTYAAVTCSGDEVWVGNSWSSQIWVVDAASLSLTSPVTIPGASLSFVSICPQFTTDGAVLSPSSQVNSGPIGETVSHEITLVNVTGQSDSFTLSLGSSQWPAAISSPAVVPLADGEATTVTVSVTVPPGVSWYDTDSVEITAEAAAQPASSASSTVTTQAYAPPNASVDPLEMQVVQFPGQSSNRSLTISNGNAVTMTVAISDLDDSATSGTPDAATSVVYSTTLDNENNSHTGMPDDDIDRTICGGDSRYPIEFNIFSDALAPSYGNILTIRETSMYYGSQPFRVKLNGRVIGQFQSSDQAVSIPLDLPPGGAQLGANLVEIESVSGYSCIMVDWGALTISNPPADWLHETPTSLLVPPNTSRSITVTFDATNVQPANLRAIIDIATDDPIHSRIPVAASMTVEPAADMGRVAGAVSDAWTGQPLTATVELVGIHTTTARPDFEIWAPAGNHSLEVSAAGYVTVTTPVAITAGQIAVRDVALEPNQPRLQWTPATVSTGAAPGSTTTAALSVINAGPAQMNVAIFEINPLGALAAPSPEDLTGKRILYDRSHGSPSLDYYSQLVNDLTNDGATIDVNWYYPIDEVVLEGYDVLWVNCCGYQTWGYSELEAIDAWLRRGGGLLVQGHDSPATAGPASIFGILYLPANCANGSTSSIAPHPISVGVSNVWVNYTCYRLIPSSGSSIVVLDSAGQPHVVAKEANGGRIVVVGSEDFDNYTITLDDNRLLATNIMSWLARPVYSDVPWLTVSPNATSIAGHSSQDVVLTFDAANLSSGVYHATLAIEHNDPAETFPAEVPITFTVHPPTAVTMIGMSADPSATPAAVPSLPLAAAPAVAAAALTLAGRRRRSRQQA